jgi:hypothetical protein
MMEKQEFSELSDSIAQQNCVDLIDYTKEYIDHLEYDETKKISLFFQTVTLTILQLNRFLLMLAEENKDKTLQHVVNCGLKFVIIAVQAAIEKMENREK